MSILYALRSVGAEFSGVPSANIRTALSTHDADIKALLANIQAGVDANGVKL